jgi:calnexin
MRINAAFTSALVSSATLMGYAHAEEADAQPDATTSLAEKPTFTVGTRQHRSSPHLRTDALFPIQPTTLKAPFLEQFTDDWQTRWTPSHAKKEDSTSEEDWAYVGEWAVEEPTVLKGMEGDKGLVVKNPAAHHAISAKFPKKIDNKGKTLVVQYEVKPQSKRLPQE